DSIPKDEPYRGPSFVDARTIELLSLTGEEERQLSALVARTVTQLREWETERFEQQGKGLRLFDIQVLVPGDPELGREFREGFLAEVRAIVGEERSYLYVSKAQESFEKRFGNFGAEDKMV